MREIAAMLLKDDEFTRQVEIKIRQFFEVGIDSAQERYHGDDRMIAQYVPGEQYDRRSPNSLRNVPPEGKRFKNCNVK